MPLQDQVTPEHSLELMDPLELSIRLLQRLKEGVPPDDVMDALKWMTEERLLEAIGEEPRKKAFWANIYNGFSFDLVRKEPERLSSLRNKLRHFKERDIKICHEYLSLNDIEHGMLRRSKVWWAKGYLIKLEVDDFEKKARVTRLDPRIHFALNCGAVSCPPIRAFTKDMEEELEEATRGFLESSTFVKGDRVKVSRIFKMFSGDFGGEKGVLRFLADKGVIGDPKGKRLQFLSYDWTPDLEPFAE